MKFNQLADGQQFEYQGIVYTRSGPIMATDADGKSKMIPRSAEVRVTSTPTEARTPAAQKTITLDKAIVAFESYHAQFVQCLRNHTDEAGRVDMEQIEECFRTVKDTFKQGLE